MTAFGDATMRQLAFRVLVERAGPDAGARAVADAAQRAYDDLTQVATPLIGRVAVDALTGRALYLAQQAHTWLGTARQAREWSGPFAQVVSGLEQQAPAVALEAAGAFLATLTELLVTFIGQSLTMRLVQQAWPDALADAEPRRHKA